MHYSSMEYEPWNSMENDIMYRGSYMQPMQLPSIEKYPPEAVILRPDQYDQDVGPPATSWPELSLADKQLVVLSPAIGNFSHISKLYLLNNNLTTLPGRLFTGLINLTFLDVSNNRLTHLPREIENAQKLRQLLIVNNNITTLPLEMGRLWRLNKLTLDDNRITTPPNSIVKQGTQKIIAYLRDNMPSIDPLPPRQWIVAPQDQQTGSMKLKVFTYNILAESYATEEQHPYAPSHVLDFNTRKYKILERILASGADIICLQEVEGKQFQKFFLPELRKKGYEGVQKLKTRAKTMSNPGSVDGCSIFYLTSRLRLEDRIDIEYQSLAYNLPTGTGLDRTIRRDNVALFLILQILPENNVGKQNNKQHRRVLVCNTHIHWDPSEADVKLMQAQFMLEEIDKICTQRNEPNMPLIIAGDFNSEPTNAVYSLMENGAVGPDHIDWNNTNYGSYSKNGCSHRFHLKNCFDDLFEPTFTNFNGDFMGILDYIWYTEDSIRVLGISRPPTKDEILTQNSPLPNSNYPSDHIYILTELEVLPKRRSI